MDVHALADFEALAREALSPEAWGYYAGGAWDEVTLRENEAAFRRRFLRPRVLVDVSRVDTATTILGERISLPVGVAPVALQGLAHPEGEVVPARVAGRTGLPYVLSTFSSRSLETVAAWGGVCAGSSSTSRRTGASPSSSSGGPPKPATGPSCSPWTCRGRASGSASGATP